MTTTLTPYIWHGCAGKYNDVIINGVNYIKTKQRCQNWQSVDEAFNYRLTPVMLTLMDFTQKDRCITYKQQINGFYINALETMISILKQPTE